MFDVKEVVIDDPELISASFGIVNQHLEIIFMSNNKQIGRLWFEDDQLHFEGRVGDSARQFFDLMLKPIADAYIQDRLSKKQ